METFSWFDYQQIKAVINTTINLITLISDKSVCWHIIYCMSSSQTSPKTCPKSDWNASNSCALILAHCPSFLILSNHGSTGCVPQQWLANNYLFTYEWAGYRPFAKALLFDWPSFRPSLLLIGQHSVGSKRGGAWWKLISPVVRYLTVSGDWRQSISSGKPC